MIIVLIALIVYNFYVGGILMHNKVKEYRKKKNISIQNLAKEAGVTKSMIYQIEREEKLPSLKVAQRISKTLGESLEILFPFEENELL